VELTAAVFDAVERSHLEAGREMWPTPRVRDFGGWLRESYLQRQLTQSDSPRALSELEERELWRTVIDGIEAERDFLDPTAAARAAQRARRLVYEYGIPLQALAADPSEEVQAFLDWNRAFEQRCRALGCLSADSFLGLMPRAEIRLAWIESPVWRPMARRWLSQNGQILSAQETAAESLSRLHAPSAAAELSAIADWARVNLNAHASFRAWICVPDLSRRRAEVIDAFDAALAPRRFGLQGDVAAPYAVAGGTPLAEFAPVRVALDTLDASAGMVPFVKFSALLRAPQLQGSPSDASAAALLDVELRARAPSHADLESWLKLADRVALVKRLGAVTAVQRLQATRQVLAASRGSHRFSEWVCIWIAALEVGPWAGRGRWSSTEFQAAERFRELLAALATADAIFGAHSEASAFRVLRRVSRDTQFQAQTGVPPIWISGQLLDPWLNYDGLWISGCGDDQWPAPAQPVPLLPVHLQRQYGVISASADSQLAQAVDLQNRWQARGRHCIFSYADRGEGSFSAASPLLPQPARPLYSGESAPPIQPHWRAQLQSGAQLERLIDEMAPPFSDIENTHGVATLRAQSRCAFRGFAETRLDAHRLDQPVPGFNERERGELTHHALEVVWSELRNSAMLEQLSLPAQTQLLDRAARHALELVCRRRDPGPRWRGRERDRLRNLLALWLNIERNRAPFSVESLEQHSEAAKYAGLSFKVRIDRVDRLADGARVLIDYKTGSANPDWRGARPDNPQLPIYALLRPEGLVAVAYARVNAAIPGFVAEAERRDIFKPRSRNSSLEGMPNFAALVQVWAQRIEAIAAAFAAGRAEVAPTLKACKSCDLQGLCRIPAALEEPDDFHG
jgi:ATP-dependent helicase/nuclease subunit B